MPVEFSRILQNITRCGLGSDSPSQASSDSSGAPCAADPNSRGDFTIAMQFACSLLMAEGSTFGMNSSLTFSMLYHRRFKSNKSLQWQATLRWLIPEINYNTGKREKGCRKLETLLEENVSPKPRNGGGTWKMHTQTIEKQKKLIKRYNHTYIHAVLSQKHKDLAHLSGIPDQISERSHRQRAV